MLGVVELDHQHREWAVVADGAVRLLTDKCVDELRVPDPRHRVDHPIKRARGAVALAVATAWAVLRSLGDFRVAVPAGDHWRILVRGMGGQGEFFQAPAGEEPS